MAERIICLAVGYGFGMVLFAEVVSRLRWRKSAREIGSHNPGTANITRQMGVKWGLVVLAGDLLKTGAACWLCAALFPELGRVGLSVGGHGGHAGAQFPAVAALSRRQGRGHDLCALVLFSPLWGGASVVLGGIVVLVTGYLPVAAVVICAAALWPGWLLGGAEGLALTGGVPRPDGPASPARPGACGAWPGAPRAAQREGKIRKSWKKFTDYSHTCLRHRFTFPAPCDKIQSAAQNKVCAKSELIKELCIMAEFSFKNIFLAGVGATAYSVEKAQELVNDLVKKGDLTVQQGKVVNEELKHNMSEKLRSAADSLENAGKKAGEAAEKAAGQAQTLLDHVEELTAEQRAALKAKLEQLEEKSDDGEGEA